MSTVTKKTAVLFVWLLMPLLAQAQMMDPVTFTVTDAPDEVKAGERFTVSIQAQIEGDWHLYSINNDPEAGPFPTEFSSASSVLQIAGEVQESEPVVEVDPNFNVELGWHTRQATFTVPMSFSAKATKAGALVVEVFYQVCNDRVCLPPKTKTITHPVAIAGVAENPAPFTAPPAASADTSTDNAEQTTTSATDQSSPQISTAGGTGMVGEGIFSFLWLALTAGFAALLTPCVFPMIPLTVSFFSKQNEGEGRGAVIPALSFGVAIVATFTILGALLALVIGASGANQFASNPWVNLMITAVLVVFALSLLGAFELRLPYQLTNWLNKQSNEKSGAAGVLFMALTISAVSFSCTAPFVGGVLAATAGGQWFYPIIGMIGFSAAFASPFVLFALFPRWLESLPKSGSWMNVVKVLLGFIELAAAFKFLSNVDLVWGWGLISRPLVIAAWITIFLLAGLYILGFIVLKHEEKPQKIGTGRLLLAIPCFLFSFYLIPGLLGTSLGIWDAWLPPKQATDVSVVASLATVGGGGGTQEEQWSDDYQASVESATQNSEPVFIDFTGYTCTNCRAMEANVFPAPPVQEHFASMELVRLYTDGGEDGPENQKFQFEFTGTVALPTYVIVDPSTQKILAKQVGYTQKKEFVEFLKRGLTKFKASEPQAIKRSFF